MNTDLKFYADQHRHLICEPYSIENLHRMAKELNIHRAWFHAGHGNGAAIERPMLAHYDIPKRRVDAILKDPRVTVIKQRQLYMKIKVAMALEARITQALDQAIRDGYELWLFSPYEAARDIHEYDETLKLVPAEKRIPIVVEWYRRKFIK